MQTSMPVHCPTVVAAWLPSLSFQNAGLDEIKGAHDDFFDPDKSCRSEHKICFVYLRKEITSGQERTMP
jgi:hypothetical protein